MSGKVLQPIATATDNSPNWAAFAATKAAAVVLPNDDSSTYIEIIYNDTGRQSYTLTATRGIPTTSTITTVNGVVRCDTQDTTGDQQLRILSRLGGSTGNFDITVPNGMVTPWTTYTNVMPRPGGGSWTPADVNNLNLEVGVNLVSWNASGGVPGIRVTTLYLQVLFTQGAPTVTTNAATSVGAFGATLNGTINPGGATAQFPVSYYFQWGTTTAYGNVTSTVTGLTGSGSTVVLEILNGLSANSTYHYRLVGTNTDNTIFGSDASFTTGISDVPLMVF